MPDDPAHQIVLVPAEQSKKKDLTTCDVCHHVPSKESPVGWTLIGCYRQPIDRRGSGNGTPGATGREGARSIPSNQNPTAHPEVQAFSRQLRICYWDCCEAPRLNTSTSAHFCTHPPDAWFTVALEAAADCKLRSAQRLKGLVQAVSKAPPAVPHAGVAHLPAAAVKAVRTLLQGCAKVSLCHRGGPKHRPVAQAAGPPTAASAARSTARVHSTPMLLHQLV